MSIKHPGTLIRVVRRVQTIKKLFAENSDITVFQVTTYTRRTDDSVIPNAVLDMKFEVYAGRLVDERRGLAINQIARKMLSDGTITGDDARKVFTDRGIEIKSKVQAV